MWEQQGGWRLGVDIQKGRWHRVSQFLLTRFLSLGCNERSQGRVGWMLEASLRWELRSPGSGTY